MAKFNTLLASLFAALLLTALLAQPALAGRDAPKEKEDKDDKESKGKALGLSKPKVIGCGSGNNGSSGGHDDDDDEEDTDGGLACVVAVDGAAELAALLELLEKDGKYSTVLGLLQLVPELLDELKAILSYGELTLLLPTDDALLDLEATVLVTLRSDLVQLAAFLRAHIIAARLRLADLLCLPDNAKLVTLSGGILVKASVGDLLKVSLKVLDSDTPAIISANVFANAKVSILGLSLAL
jgi:hypothetical protein